jgi:uncharacterized protein YebE (UPF0316 family)
MELFLESLLIVILRLADVSLGTVRIVLLARGSRWRAAAIGFVETLIWVFAVTLVLQELDDPVRMFAYALGFGLGTLLGVTLERAFAVGTVLIQAVAPVTSPSSAPTLRALGYRVTELNGEGHDGSVRMVITVIPRRRTSAVLQTIRDVNPEAFVTTEDVAVANLWRRASAVRK